MGKASVSTKASGKGTGKTPAAFSKKNDPPVKADNVNPSKISPTSGAVNGLPALDSRDGVIKLFTDSIRDLYWAENHLVKALPKMAKAASSKTLSQSILNHLEQTKTHVKRLEQVFATFGLPPKAKKCDAMEGLTKEGEAVVETTDQGTPARDLGIIMASQKVEHYEISAYTGLVKLAADLEMADVSAILAETLHEEIETDNTLAGIASTDIDF